VKRIPTGAYNCLNATNSHSLIMHRSTSFYTLAGLHSATARQRRRLTRTVPRRQSYSTL